MKRFACVALLVLAGGMLGPFVSAASGGPSCCCGEGESSCPLSSGSCAWTNGCGDGPSLSPAPLTVFVIPPAFAGPAPAYAGRIAAPASLPAAADGAAVPDPPPRA